MSDGHEGEYDRRRGHRTVRKCDTACNNGNSKQLGLTLEQGVSEKVGAGDQRPAGLPREGYYEAFGELLHCYPF